MTRRSCDGAGLLRSFRAAVGNLEAHVDEVNGLNVYPVPDGDTGSNMVATVRAALAEAERAGSDSVERVAAAISFGALMGARGNSGVITSQIVRGMAEGMVSKRRFNGLDLAHALTVGTTTAYAAVGKPVEGTILTVIREASVAAVAAAERDNDLEVVLAATVEAAEAAVARTPSLLPILREAGVVDAGGQGLLRMMQGALAYLRGTEVRREPTDRAPEGPARETRPSTLVAHADEGFGYETMFLLQPHPGQSLDVDSIRTRLQRIGESVLVAGDPRAVKVHVHNERPDEVLAYGLSLGSLSRINVENLDSQARDVRERRAAAFTEEREVGHHEIRPADDPRAGAPGASPGRNGSSGPAAAPDREAPAAAIALGGGRPGGAPASADGRASAGGETSVGVAVMAATEPVGPDLATPPSPPAVPDRVAPLAVIAVAAGDGLAAVFESFGVAAVVRGGQAANPSTGELLAAVDRVDAQEVLLLPNNPNVVLAARQVAGMTRIPVHVVPTRNAAEGVAALLALDPALDAAENAGQMMEAAHSIQTLQVTDAVRDARIGGHKVKKGQTIALDPDDGLVAVGGDRDRVVLQALQTLRPGFELITLYYGDGAGLAEAEGVSRLIAAWRPDVEVELVHGGQPHYRYLVAAE
jgi:dihydroxyacetone kinase-like predicted kinase